jgi:hypothetical protein
LRPMPKTMNVGTLFASRETRKLSQLYIDRLLAKVAMNNV